jgi:hypothetical protein
MRQTMTNLASVFQPAIDALEKDLADLERQANGLLTSINLLRAKAGLPPRPGGWSSAEAQSDCSGTSKLQLHSDSFTGKKLGSAVREYLEMRKASGADSPATSREIFDALKLGGFVTGAKDDATALVVLRTMLRKNTTMFVKLQNGKYGIRAWYGNLRAPKESTLGKGADEDEDDVGVEEEMETETETEAETGSEKVSAA